MHHEALLRAKTALVTVPCLTYRLEGFFVLDTDASNHATGTLFNKFRWERNCNLYTSHVLMKSQRKYCTARKEHLAMMKLCRQFGHYLLSRRFMVLTNYNSLMWLLRLRHIECHDCALVRKTGTI